MNRAVHSGNGNLAQVPAERPKLQLLGSEGPEGGIHTSFAPGPAAELR